MPGKNRSPEPGPSRGFFLTLEGIEGSGKSTHARLLAERLRHDGYVVVLTREPGGTRIGEKLRDILLGSGEETPTPVAELMVILAARAQHVAQVVRPGLERGEVVISDRYADASLAYQGGARGLGIERVAAVNAFATSNLMPDLTILCDLPVERGMERVAHRRQGGGDFNRFDREARAFYEAVRTAYLRVAAAEPDRFVLLDADRVKEIVARDLLRRVLPALEARRRAGGLAAG